MSPIKISFFALRSIVLAGLLAGTLIACGATAPLPATPAPGPTPTITVPFEMPTTISIAGRFRAQELAILDQQIATFEAANPELRVEVVDIRGNANQRRERTAERLGSGDSSIDIFVLDGTWLAEFAEAGWLLPLNDYVEPAGLSLAEFLGPAVQASTIDGQLMALPWTVDGGVLYYRKDLLDRYGYAPPTTWPDLQRMALAIKGQEDLPYGFVWQGAAYGALTCNTLEFVWAYGGRVLDEAGDAVFDSPQSRAGLQAMTGLIASGASPEDTSDYYEQRTLEAFEGGQAVFMRNWANTAQTLGAEDAPLRGQVGLAPLPASCLVEQGLALSVSGRQPAKAFRFVAFLASQRQQVQWARYTGLLPALTSAYDDAEILAWRPSLQGLPAILSAARPLPQTAAYPAISEAIYQEANAMLAGEQDGATAAARIQQRIEAALAQSRRPAPSATP